MADDRDQTRIGAVTPKKPVHRGPLRFGIDIDGTISQAPRHFKRLIEALMLTGNHVYIITARRENLRPETEALLSSFGIHYTELIMMPVEWPRTVAEYKVQEVRRKDVHIMIDDDVPNCWAIETETEALAAHMLPIPELAEGGRDDINGDK